MSKSCLSVPKQGESSRNRTGVGHVAPKVASDLDVARKPKVAITATPLLKTFW
jgi:hypothetical protein